MRRRYTEILVTTARILCITRFREMVLQASAVTSQPRQPEGMARGELPHRPLQLAGQRTRPEAIARGWLSEVADVGSINRLQAHLQLHFTLENSLRFTGLQQCFKCFKSKIERISETIAIVN